LTDASRVTGAHKPSTDPDLKLQGQEQWYVAQALHHREKIAELHLRAQGFRPFFPQFRKTVRHARKLRERGQRPTDAPGRAAALAQGKRATRKPLRMHPYVI
jgi:hypothetical protein